jgi:geranylgeranyl diphosphate synthase type I
VKDEQKTTLVKVRESIEIELSDFLSKQSAYLESISSDLAPVAHSLSSFLLDGGKRLRPLFAYSAFIGAGGVANKNVIRAISSLELLQACALIHDDLMDGSDTRRGKPSIHRHFETIHQREEMEGFAERYGMAAAVLLGDLALVLSDQMLNSAGLDSAQMHSVLPVHDEMRVELMAGQFLDIHEQTQKNTSVERSLTIARYKSGKYTIERPLQLGAAVAIPDPLLRAQLVSIYSEFGLPLGEAFQLRDDLLGVFGDPKVTGKPAGDDLREGKRTVLMAMTHDRISGAAEAEFMAEFGNHDISENAIARLQEIIAETGAAMHVEDLIEELTSTALEALNRDEIVPQARELLTEMAIIATKRNM